MGHIITCTQTISRLKKVAEMFLTSHSAAVRSPSLAAITCKTEGQSCDYPPAVHAQGHRTRNTHLLVASSTLISRSVRFSVYFFALLTAVLYRPW